ncbi:MAG: DUF5320 domain-containing protein [Thermovirga sp.]|nr:DUF5320 domain-containing protein [Thermovirga sp.]
MPRGDRTGPAGMGPMTGRRAGYCAGFPVPGYMNPWGGRGYYGWGRGGFWRWGRGGRGFGRRFWGPWPYAGVVPPEAPYAEPTAEEEKELLKDQAEALQKELEAIKKRLEELES